jgi:hypothetical protein
MPVRHLTRAELGASQRHPLRVERLNRFAADTECRVLSCLGTLFHFRQISGTATFSNRWGDAVVLGWY